MAGDLEWIWKDEVVMRPFHLKTSQSQAKTLTKTLIFFPQPHPAYSAPFFTTWFCSMGTTLFLPLYALCRLCCCKVCRLVIPGSGSGVGGGVEESPGVGQTVRDSIRGMRDKGLTPAR